MSEKLQVGDIARPWGLTIAPEVRIEKALETGGYSVSWFDNAMRPCSCTVADDEVVFLRRRDPNAPEEIEAPPKFNLGDRVCIRSIPAPGEMVVVYPRTPAGVQVLWFDKQGHPVFENFPEDLLAKRA